MNSILPRLLAVATVLAPISPSDFSGAPTAPATTSPSSQIAPRLPDGMVPGPRPAAPPEPRDNPGTPAKRLLGRQLFFDPILSDTRDVSCATCHHPKYAWADGRTVPLGVGGSGLGPSRRLAEPSNLPALPRNTPTLLDVGFNGLVSGIPLQPEHSPMFWDSRIQGLESQVPTPLAAAGEMCSQGCTQSAAIQRTVQRLRSIPEYVASFRTAFGPGKPEDITGTRLAQAIAAFERSLVSGPTAFDRFLAGETAALTTDQQTGFRIFRESGCIQCHGGPMFSDFKLHVIGLPGDGGRAFRTPSLRNLRHTGPYMHDGSLRTLRDVLVFYEELDEAVSETLDGADVRTPPLDPLLRLVRLDPEEFPALESFLDSLSSDQFDATVPESVPSGLPVERGQ